MKVPQVLRKQVLEYEKAGFHVTNIEPRSGSHFMLTFAEFSQPVITTKNVTCPRAIKNNIANYRRLQREQGEK